jgi:putative SOS response-associated peptidase YedK
MCGKFTAKASWADIVDHAWSAPSNIGDEDRIVTLRVMNDVRVIVCDGGERYVMAMRWGFPDPADWRRPRPIHARAETIDTTPSFAAAFRNGQRGIVLMNTFNEAPESGAQHVVDPGNPVGVAFVWRRFDIGGSPMLACVMVTVAANALLGGLPTDRMPAILAPEDWATWLGEEDASAADIKACLKTVDGARWTMTREERTRTTKRRKPVVSDPAGLF